MKTWRKELYKSYSTNKLEQNIGKNDCSFFMYRILPFLPEDKKTSIIDLAAGHGDLIQCLNKVGFENTKGVDISKEEIEIAQQNGVRNILQGDIFNFMENTQEKFDVIFMMDILEHFTRKEFFKVLRLVFKTLNKNGILIAQVPNATGLFGMRIRYGDITHETCFTHNSIIQSLTLVKFNKIKTIELSPIKTGIKGILRNLFWHVLILPLRLILILETGIKRHILSQNMLIVAKKSIS